MQSAKWYRPLKEAVILKQCDKSGKENCKFQFIDNIMSITVHAGSRREFYDRERISIKFIKWEMKIIIY